MIIGCFALVEPFCGMERQFHAVKEMGIDYADITDNHNGGSLGVEYGFAASISLDSHPSRIRKMAEDAGIMLTAFCAHANLLDPVCPPLYQTHEIIKAIRLAHLLGIRHVITTEGDPKTPHGHNLTPAERLFAIRDKLVAPVLWAEELGVELLIEPHGIVTDTIDGMGAILEALGHDDTVGVCLDTGNAWLGGSDPIDFIRVFGSRIRHVHWKDMGAEWEDKRGTLFGCGMGSIALGDGRVDLPGIVKALKGIGFDGATTLEVAGRENVMRSAQRLREWSAQ